MKSNIKLFAGKEQSFSLTKTKNFCSSYCKKPLLEKVFVSSLGFEHDNQSDKSIHGGIDKAVCVYNQTSYDALSQKYNLAFSLCFFGENITLEGFSDDEVFIGDRFSCADVIFEVSQPRSPCWKISALTGVKNLASLIVKEAKTGFYLRVLKEGYMSASDSFERVYQAENSLSISQINKAVFNTKVHQKELEQLLSLDSLAVKYKERIQKRYESLAVGLESWQEDKV